MRGRAKRPEAPSKTPGKTPGKTPSTTSLQEDAVSSEDRPEDNEPRRAVDDLADAAPAVGAARIAGDDGAEADRDGADPGGSDPVGSDRVGTERLRVLRMVADGRITPDEGAELLAALDPAVAGP